MYDYLSAQEAARLVGCHHRTIRRAIDARQLPAFKRGNEWRIRRADLEAWWQEPLHTTPPDPRPVPPQPIQTAAPAPVAAPDPPLSGMIGFLERHGVAPALSLSWPGITTMRTMEALRYAQRHTNAAPCGNPSCVCHRMLGK